MKRLITYALIAAFFSSPANAFCIQSRGYDFQSSVNGAVEWLTCLHNEQSSILNDHADTINRVRNTSLDLVTKQQSNELEIYNLSQELQPIKNEIKRNDLDILDAEQKIVALEETIAALERRISELESAR